MVEVRDVSTQVETVTSLVFCMLYLYLVSPLNPSFTPLGLNEPQEQHSVDNLLPALEYHPDMDGIPMQGEDGQHYVVLEAIQCVQGVWERVQNLC